MKCKFCNSTWKTKKAKGTRSHFSLKATFVWLIWIAAILFVLYKANAFVNMKAHMKPARNAAQVVENVDAENEEAVAPSVYDHLPDDDSVEEVVETSAENAEG